MLKVPHFVSHKAYNMHKIKTSHHRAAWFVPMEWGELFQVFVVSLDDRHANVGARHSVLLALGKSAIWREFAHIGGTCMEVPSLVRARIVDIDGLQSRKFQMHNNEGCVTLTSYSHAHMTDPEVAKDVFTELGHQPVILQSYCDLLNLGIYRESDVLFCEDPWPSSCRELVEVSPLPVSSSSSSSADSGVVTFHTPSPLLPYLSSLPRVPTFRH